MKLYAAYGANTNIEHVKALSAEAIFDGIGVLKGYEVVYRGIKEEKYATIEKREEKETKVVLWRAGEGVYGDTREWILWREYHE